MSFESDIQNFQARLLRRAEALNEQVAEDVFDSVRDGSPVTGSPGQPYRRGTLYRSWSLVKNGWRSVVSTTSLYARKAELREARSDISKGGRLSVAQTVANFSNLVIAAVRKIR